MADALTQTQLYFTAGVTVGMYFITTLMLGLQLTFDIFRMRQPNLLTRVTGIAMLVDAANLFIPAVLITSNNYVAYSSMELLVRMLDYVILLLLLCIGDVLVYDRLSRRKFIVTAIVILPTIAAYAVWGKIVLDLVAIPVFVLSVFAVYVNCRRIIRYDKNLAYLYSNMENKSKQWYIWICASLIVEILIWLWAYWTEENSILPKLAYYIFMTGFWMFLFRFTSMQKSLAIDTVSITNLDLEEEEADCTEGNAETAMKNGEKSELLQRIEAIMMEKKLFLTPDLSLLTLAELLGSNRTYVSHVFNKELNTTFYQYVNNLRVEYAYKRIVESDDKMANIALECGFRTSAYLARVMREHTGKTPSQIRAERGEAEHTEQD